MKNTGRLIIVISIAVALHAALLAPGCKNAAPGKDSKAEVSVDEELQAGIEMISSQQLEEGIKHLDKVIELDPKNSRAWCAKGTALRLQKKLPEAVRLYEKAVSLNPKYVVCYDNLGLAYIEMNKVDEAMAAFTKAIDLDSAYADAHFNLGMLYDRELNDRANALKEYEQYISLSEDEAKKNEVEKRIAELSN